MYFSGKFGWIIGLHPYLRLVIPLGNPGAVPVQVWWTDWFDVFQVGPVTCRFCMMNSWKDTTQESDLCWRALTQYKSVPTSRCSKSSVWLVQCNYFVILSASFPHVYSVPDSFQSVNARSEEDIKGHKRVTGTKSLCCLPFSICCLCWNYCELQVLWFPGTKLNFFVHFLRALLDIRLLKKRDSERLLLTLQDGRREILSFTAQLELVRTLLKIDSIPVRKKNNYQDSGQNTPKRLHSSRMHTTWCLVLRGVPGPRGMHDLGGCLVPGMPGPGGCLVWWGLLGGYPSMHWGRPPVNRILDTRYWKYYLPPQTSFAGSNKDLSLPSVLELDCHWRLFVTIQLHIVTRMHSSRMHTVRCSCRLLKGVSAWRGCLSDRWVCPGVVSALGDVSGRHPSPWTEFLTHACENITFPQFRLQTVSIYITFWWWRKVFRDYSTC